MISNIINTVFTRSASLLINFLLVVLSAQLLGSDGRGVLGLFIASYSLIMMFIQFIGGSTIVYLGNKHSYKSLWIPSIFAGFLICFIAYPIFINSEYMHFKSHYINYNLHLCVMAFLHSTWQTNTYLLLSNERIKANNTIQLVYLAVVLISFLFIYYCESQNVWSYILALYIGNILSIIVSQWLIRNDWLISGKNIIPFKKSISELIKHGFIAQLANVLQFLNYRISYFILEAFVSIADIGLYSVCVQFCEAIWVIAKSLSMVLYSKISNENDDDKAKYLCLILAKYSFAITVLISLFIIFIPDIAFQKIFGNDFVGLGLTIQFLLPGVCAFGFTMLLSSYFSGRGLFQINTISSFIGFVFIVPSAYFLIKEYGINGAAMASSISYCSSAIFLLIMFFTKHKISFLKILPEKNELKVLKDLLVNSFGRSQSRY